MIMIYSDLKNQNLNQDISENDIQDDHDFEYQNMSKYGIKDNWDLFRS